MPLITRIDEVIKMAVIQSPFICPLAIAGTGIINNEYFKSLFYILGLMVLFASHLFLSPLISGEHGRISKKKKGFERYSSACQAFSIMPESDYYSPAWSSTLLTFSFAYLLIPQIVNNYSPSPLFITFFSLFIFIDGLVRWKNLGCYGDGASGIAAIIIGVFFGGIIGGLWWVVVNYIIGSDFTFFNEPGGDRLKCNKPKKNHMKCTVYKNGKKAGTFLK